jgi:hypothetical protein
VPFTANPSSLTVDWQWAASVYTKFGDYGALDVKSVDDPNHSANHLSDHAGTPELFKSFVVGGACGGGGSNYTGSLSATDGGKPPACQ